MQEDSVIETIQRFLNGLKLINQEKETEKCFHETSKNFSDLTTEGRGKFSVNLDASLMKELDTFCRKTHEKRNRVIERAIDDFLDGAWR